MVPCEIENLKKMYSQNVGVQDITFNVKEGEIVGFIGPNGAGKTTTIRCLAGLLQPTYGTVAIVGIDAIKNGYKARKELGYCGSDFSFFKKLTVMENLKFVADVKNVSYDRINYLATKLELNTTRKVNELSLGNKKKLSIVMALLSSPKLIVLDEPTMGLDPIIKQSLFELLLEEKKRGAAILISSHQLDDIQRLCDRVAIIKDGKILAVQQMQELKLKSLKHVSIETKYSIPEITLSGVSNLKKEGQYIEFNYNGEMQKLIKFLDSVDIDNVSIENASLEEIFLHFYE